MSTPSVEPYRTVQTVPGTDQPVRDVYLRPGQIWFGDHTHCVRTLLGSCIAITLWHPERRVGGMCHYLLSEGNRVQSAEQPGYYADAAMAWFIRTMRELRLRPQDMEAKFFGGACMFEYSGRPGRGAFDVSRRNIERGRQLLHQHGITIRAEDVGGRRHRALHFELWSGQVWRRYGRNHRENNL